MLRKLMKHEFRATGRTMLPLFLIVLATAFGANLSTRGLMETEYHILDILGGLLMTAFVVAIMAVCIMSVVVMVQRFYKNLLQDEGYLMMTLPVSVHQHIWSKLIVSSVWFAATGLVVALAGLILAFNVGFVREVFEGFSGMFREITAYYAVNGTALVIEFIVLCFVACCTLCLQFYAALAAGHSRPNHKMFWSVGCFFGFQFLLQLLGSMAIILLVDTGALEWAGDLVAALTGPWHINAMTATHLMMMFLIVVSVVYGAIFYFVTTFFLKKHLNLE